MRTKRTTNMTSTTITAMIPPSRLVLLLDVSRVPIADRVGDADISRVSVTDDVGFLVSVNAVEDAVDTEHTVIGEANCIIKCYIPHFLHEYTELLHCIL